LTEDQAAARSCAISHRIRIFHGPKRYLFSLIASLHC
jgi:hypothetical protein